jgi:hypothetical protein
LLLLVDEKDRTLLGTVTRKIVCTLMKHKAFTFGFGSPMHINNQRVSSLLNWGTIEHVYPNYPDILDLQLTGPERSAQYTINYRLCTNRMITIGTIGWISDLIWTLHHI